MGFVFSLLEKNRRQAYHLVVEVAVMDLEVGRVRIYFRISVQRNWASSKSTHHLLPLTPSVQKHSEKCVHTSPLLLSMITVPKTIS